LFVSLPAQIGALLMASVCLFAAWPGARPQRWAAIAVAVAWVGSSALQDRADTIDPQYAIFMLDLAAAVFFTALALKFRRGWLMAMAAFQLLTTATHIAVMIDTRIWVRAYLTAYLVWSYALLLALLWGGVLAWRERAKPPRD
jgi:hypothetical protein